MTQGSRRCDTWQVNCNHKQEPEDHLEKLWCTVYRGAGIPSQESPTAGKGVGGHSRRWLKWGSRQCGITQSVTGWSCRLLQTCVGPDFLASPALLPTDGSRLCSPLYSRLQRDALLVFCIFMIQKIEKEPQKPDACRKEGQEVVGCAGDVFSWSTKQGCTETGWRREFFVVVNRMCKRCGQERKGEF